jgi:hypothetical protein
MAARIHRNVACFLPPRPNLTQEVHTTTISSSALGFRNLPSSVLKIQHTYLSQPADVCFLQHRTVAYEWLRKMYNNVKAQTVNFVTVTRKTCKICWVKMPSKVSILAVFWSQVYLTSPAAPFLLLRPTKTGGIKCY